MPSWNVVAVVLVAATLSAVTVNLAFPVQQPERYQQLAAEILREMVEFPSASASIEQTVVLLEAVMKRLAAAGFEEDAMTFVTSPGDIPNLVVRYAGTGQRRPVMLMAHVDVVDARVSAWQVHPFTFVEEGGYYYGRGTSDNKAGATTLVTNFIRLRDEGYVPERDLIMVLTGDEETSGGGINHLVNNERTAGSSSTTTTLSVDWLWLLF